MEPSSVEHQPGGLPDSVVTSDLFRSFPEQVHLGLLAVLEGLFLPAATPLFEQGDAGDGMYLVRSGRVGVLMQVEGGGEQLIAECGPGASVGELALITGKPRTARAYTLEDSELLRLSQSSFKDLAALHPDAVRRFTERLLPRLRRSQVVGVLGGLFGPLTPEALGDLVAALDWRSLSSGEVLFRQGDPGDYVAIVVTGRLRVEVAGEKGAPRAVAELGRGQYVGELAVLTGEPRSATVVAVRDADLALLNKAAFERLLAQHPAAMMHLTRVVIGRLRTTTSAPASAPRAFSLALIPLSPEVPVAALAAQLADALRPLGPTMQLDAAGLGVAFGRPEASSYPEDHPVSMTLRGWLSEREAEHRVMLYVADPEPGAWTQRCVRQADLLVLLGMAASDGLRSANEAAIDRLGLPTRRTLVLIQPPGAAEPVGATRWLARRQVDAHYHVRVTSRSKGFGAAFSASQ